MGETLEASERVRVVVRVRPPNERELQSSVHSCQALTVDDEASQVVVSKRKAGNEVERDLRFSYDHVFGEKANQVDVFEYLRDGVQQVAQGFNCTIFAYGQTGTGKTHTMLGTDVEHHLDLTSSVSEAPESSPNWGVIPRAIESLFDELRSISHHGSAGIVHCSYMQIYNNDVFDLLQENKQRMKDPLAVRELIKGNGKQIYVSGLSEFRVTSVQEALQFLKAGNRNRTIRSTSFNEKSSRSHALLQLSVEVESRGMESATTIIRRAKLNLVDLAGSEKWDTDIAMGSDRSKELTSINQSLSALGNVISALVNPRRTHIPYRDSKLTRLLQDSLGGNTRTVVIATISPAESAVDETISTLQFADRAKRVTVRVKANELVDDAILLAQAQREISRLKLLLKQSSSHQQISALGEQVGKLIKEKASLIGENQKLRRKIANLRRTSSGPVISDNTTATKLKDAKLLISPHPAPQAQHNNVRRSDDRPHSSSSSSLQLNQLRLDLKVLGEPRTRPEVFMAFADENADNEHFEQAAKAQEIILHEIQTERRNLERQLELLSGNQAHENENRNNETQYGANGEDEPCPICGRVIDDHNDVELDRCIELEMKMVKQQNAKTVIAAPLSDRSLPDATKTQQRLDSQDGKEVRVILNGPHTGATPRNTASDPRIRRVSSSAHGKASPYSLSAVRKPSTPQQSRIASKPGEGGSTGNRSSETFPFDNRMGINLQRSNSSRSSGDANNQTDTQSSASTLSETSIPIMRQGHKGLKALKKFRSESPYNSAMLRKQKRVPSPQVSSSVTTNASEGSHPSISFANSVCDIGLELSVYKFRYDCWYSCTVVGYDKKRRMHCCQYDCGDKQWQDLSSNKVKIIGRVDDSM